MQAYIHTDNSPVALYTHVELRNIICLKCIICRGKSSYAGSVYIMRRANCQCVCMFVCVCVFACVCVCVCVRVCVLRLAGVLQVSCGCLAGVLQYQSGILRVSCGRLAGVLRVCGCLAGVSRVSRVCLAGVLRVSCALPVSCNAHARRQPLPAGTRARGQDRTARLPAAAAAAGVASAGMGSQ